MTNVEKNGNSENKEKLMKQIKQKLKYKNLLVDLAIKNSINKTKQKLLKFFIGKI